GPTAAAVGVFEDAALRGRVLRALRAAAARSRGLGDNARCPSGGEQAMTEALVFIVGTLLRLALFVVMARLLLQWTRADFRNPLCQAVGKLTTPLLLPVRRLLPPIGKIDTASVVAVLLVAIVYAGTLFALTEGFPPPVMWIRPVLMEIARTLLWTYFYAIVLYALLSLIAPGGY